MLAVRQKSVAALVAASIAATGLVAGPASATGADPSNNIDQQPVRADGTARSCSVADYRGGVIVNSGNAGGATTGTRQSFVPSVGNVAAVNLCLTPILGGATLPIPVPVDLFTFDVAIYRADDLTPEGEVSRTSATFSLAEAQSDVLLNGAAWFRAELVDANLTPGVQYVMELANTSLTFAWRATCAGDVPGAPSCSPAPGAYPEGAAGVHADADHGFQTIFENGPNLIAGVIAPPMVCPALGSLDSTVLTIENQNPAVSTASFDVRLAVRVGQTRTVLGTTTIDGPFTQSTTIPVADFGVAPSTWQSAVANAAANAAPVDLELEVDTGKVVTEVNESDNLASASTTAVECGPATLSEPTLAAGNGATVEHGVTQWSYDELPAREIAAGAAGFNRQTLRVEDDGSGEPIYATPAYGTPAYGTPAYGTPAYGTPAYGTPAYGTPAYGTPAYGTTTYATPAYGTPAYGTPAYGTPAYGTPTWAGSLGVLFDSLDDRILSQIPLVAVPVSSGVDQLGWEALLEKHAEDFGDANPGLAEDVQNILDLPSQDRLLSMVLDLDPTPVITYNDADFSRVLNLSILSVALANTRLSDFAYDTTPGITNACELIEKTSHLTCAEIQAEGFAAADLTLLQLQLFGYHMGSFPLAGESVGALLDAIEARGASPEANLLFDVYLANTGFRRLADQGLLTLPTDGHYHVAYTAFGNLAIVDAFDDPASIVDCALVSCTSPDTTVADAEAAYAFVEASTVGDMVRAMSDAGRATFDVGRAIIGLHSLNNLPWGLFDRDPLHLPELFGSCPTIPLTMSATSTGQSQVIDPTFTYLLPQGWDQSSVTAFVDGVEVPVTMAAPIAQPGNKTTLQATVEAVVPVDSAVQVVADVCASTTLGTWNTQFVDISWSSFTSETDFTIVTSHAIEGQEVPGADLNAGVEVTEQGEPDEGTYTVDHQIAPNGVISRHITGPLDTDQFVVPVGELLGDSGVTLEQGDFVHFVMAPPPSDGLAVNAAGELEPVNAADFDLALYVAGVSPLVDNLFLDEGGEYGADDQDQAVLPLLGAVGNLNDPYTSLAATPAYGTPAYGTPAYGTPAYGTPAYGTGYVAPARMLSNQRGDAVEHVFTEILPGWEENSNELIVQVSGHLGAKSVKPYSLWFYVYKAVTEPVVCTPPFASVQELEQFIGAADPTAFDQVDGSTNSLLLYPQGLFAAEYDGANAPLSAELGDTLRLLAEHQKVNGVVVDPFDDPAVRDAMAAWLTTDAWCDPVAANRVHGAMRSLVLRLAERTADANGVEALEDVVVVGGDDKIPFSRHKDHTTVAHELEHYASIYNLTGTWNPLTAAHAGGFFLSPNPMVTKHPKPWGDDFIWLPDYSITRLYGTPTDVQVQIGRFFATDEVTIEEGLITGEDFLSDGAKSVAGFLADLGVDVNTDLLHDAGITDPAQLSSAEDLLAALEAAKGDLSDPTDDLDVTVLFTHADQSSLQSARGTLEGKADLVTTADVDARGLALGEVVVAASCHFGEDVPGASTWTQQLARESVTNYLLAHTTFGYGISEGIDLSEELINLATRNAMAGMEWGEAARRAMVQYFGTRSDYGDHQRKVIMSLTGSGIPWVTTVAPEPEVSPITTQSLSTTSLASSSTSATPAVKAPALQVDPVTGLDYAELDVPFLAPGLPGCTECLVRHDDAGTATTPSGTYYEAVTNNSYGGVDGPEDRPLVPKSTTVYDFGGRTIGGVLITDITSDSASGVGGDLYAVDFMNATTNVTGTHGEGATNALDVATRGPFANVRHLDGEVWVTLPRGSARGESVGPDGEVLGTYRLDTGFEGVIYAEKLNATERRPADIRDAQVFRASPPDENATTETLGVTTMVEDQSSIVRGVVALLVDDPQSTVDGAGRWIFAELARSGVPQNFTSPDGDLWNREVWTTGITVEKGVEVRSEFFQFVDANGILSFTERKGQSVLVTERATDVGDDPALLVEGTLVDGWYVNEAVVRFVEATHGVEYLVTIDGVTESIVYDQDNPFQRTISTDGYHEVTAQRRFVADATPSVQRFAVDAGAPEAWLLTPNETFSLEQNTFVAGSLVEIRTLCRDAGIGIDSCLVDAANTMDGAGLFLDTSTITGPEGLVITLRAIDRLGHETLKTARFAVVSAYEFLGFFEPIRDVTASDTTLINTHGLAVGDQYYYANPGETVPFKFTAHSRLTGDGVGATDLWTFTWTPVTLRPGREGLRPCDATSKPGYRYRHGKHRFNALTECVGTTTFLTGETWRFTVSTEDGLELSALVLMK